MSENYTKVQQAFRVLHPLLAGYICQEMRREYQDKGEPENAAKRGAGTPCRENGTQNLKLR